VPAGVIGAIGFPPIPIPPQYAGPAPLEVAGVSQINFTVGISRMLLMVGPQLFVGGIVNSRPFSLYVTNR